VIRRHLLAAAVTAAVTGTLLPVNAHAAKTPVLDGKKVTILQTEKGATRAAPAPSGPTDAQVLACSPAECGRMPFVYKPGKGVKRDLGLRAYWYWPEATRVDLYLLYGKTIVASCADKVGNTRQLLVPAKLLKPGKVYTAVMYFSYSTTNDNVHLEATLPAQYAGPGVDTSDQYNPRWKTCG
jgi:hypothetical protein